MFLHSAVVEYLKRLKKSSIDFYTFMQSTGMTVIDKDVVNKYLDHFENTVYDSKLGYTFEYSGIFSILSVRLGDTLDLVVTLRDGDCESVIYNSHVTDEELRSVLENLRTGVLYHLFGGLEEKLNESMREYLSEFEKIL